MNKKLLYQIIFFIVGIFFLQSCSKPTVVDERDGEVYKTVTIKEQTWFAENLRYNVEGSFVHPECPSEEYGRLYHWDLAQVVCPKGWHLPTDEEWTELEKANGMYGEEGPSVHRSNHGHTMKATNGWKFLENGKDRRGFAVLPAGIYKDNQYEGLYDKGEFWTASEYNSFEEGKVGWYRGFDKRNSVTRFYSSKEVGRSCRCVKDK